MKWVHPNFLFAFAVLLIPLIIHLFHFRKYKTVYFSSLTFVKNIEQEQKNPRKIKHYIILALRLLAFSALVIAFAQPYFPAQNKTQKGRIVGFYLDNSYSMSRLGVNGELMNQGKQLIESYVDQAPRNTNYLLFTNELSGNEKQLLNAKKLKDKLAKLDYSPLTRNQKELFQFWKDATKQNESIAQNTLIYLSDFQQVNFTLDRNKTSKKDQLFPIRIKPQEAGNLYIDSCWFESPVQRLGAQQRIGIRIKNSGDKALDNCVVNVRIGKINRDLFASVPANQSDTVFLDYFNQTKGLIKGSVKVNDKQMTQDDAFYFVYQVKDYSKVLLINGESAVNNVRIVFNQDSFYKVNEIDDKRYQQVNFDEYDLIVLNGLNQISTGLGNKISEHSSTGGSTFFIPGTNASIGGWNQLLNNLHMPTINGMEDVGLSIQKINFDDSFFKGVFERKPSKLGLPLVSKSYRLDNNSATMATSLLNYQNGSPFFVRSTGKNKVYMIATALDPSFSSFTTNQLFSTLLLHVGALSQKQNPFFITLGSDAFYPVSNAINADKPLHLKNEGTDFIPLIFTKNKQALLSVKGNEALTILKPGIYSLEDQGTVLDQIAINVGRTESRIDEASDDYVQKIISQNGFEVKSLKDGSSWNGAGIIQGTENDNLWKWFVIIAAIAVFGEMLVILFYKR